MYLVIWILLTVNTFLTLSQLTVTNMFEKDKEELRIEMIAQIINNNIYSNNWSVILLVGNFPNTLYKRLNNNQLTYAITNTEKHDHEFEDIVRYYSNTILISIKDYKDFEKSLMKAIASPYWHPLSKIILLFHTSEEKLVIAKIFFVMWFYSCANTILLQYDKDHLLITHYSPYMHENYKLDNIFGCYSLKKLGSSLTVFNGGFQCEETCQNVSINSKLRANNLGTCLGFTTLVFGYENFQQLRELNLFEDKSRNLHGYAMRAKGSEVLPFLRLTELGNGKYSLQERDGMLWTVISELMNFTIDLSSNEYATKTFNFQIGASEIFAFAHRKADILLLPIYQMALFVVEVDMTFAHKDSGVCIMAHRADFETILFDVKVLQDNLDYCLRFALCMLAMWLFYIIVSAIETGRFTADQIGKDLMNTIRNTLSIGVINPSKSRSFRIFLGFSIWGFFVINFTAQAAITSFFTAFKRGKEVDTFQDIVDKGYVIEGLSSPDVILPDDEEIFNVINSRVNHVQDWYSCAKDLANDSRKFCYVDCACARYIERNWLDSKGEQYLHITKDRIHSNYLNMIMPKNSPLTQQLNKHIMKLVEAGLVSKWEQYKYNNIKDSVTVYTLGLDDVIGLFQSYLILVEISFTCFVIEILIGIFKKTLRWFTVKKVMWKRTKVDKTKQKQGKIKFNNSSTQTIFP